MINKNRMLSVLLLILMLGVYSHNGQFNNVHAASDINKLTIYTYESLLADPGYDFIGAFANYSGISKSDIKLVLMDDANTIVSQAALEKDHPVADVLIGIDNVLIHSAKKEGILESYNSPTLVNISQTLIDNLDPDKYVLPYDYGIIALWFDRSRLNSTVTPQMDNLTLSDLLTLGLDNKLVVEDPTISSTGLGFLLWTIAVYGDPQLNYRGLLGSDWRAWWRNASSNIRIASSWGAAFNIYASKNENRPLMISYGTSPAYDVCHPLYGVGQNVSAPSKAVVTHENGKNNAWLQIEGIGLVKNAPHIDLAKQFIDWFLSTELQDHIPLNQWMYPANKYTTVPSCFLNASINPDNVNVLNDLISPSMLSNNLDQWKNDWENVIAQGTKPAPANNIYMVLFSVCFAALTYNILTKKKRR